VPIIEGGSGRGQKEAIRGVKIEILPPRRPPEAKNMIFCKKASKIRF
jgi:hypothetical protein